MKESFFKLYQMLEAHIQKAKNIIFILKIYMNFIFVLKLLKMFHFSFFNLKFFVFIFALKLLEKALYCKV